MQLLQHGAQVDAVDREQRSALRLASWHSQAAACLLLGCDTHTGQGCSQGVTALGTAAQITLRWSRCSWYEAPTLAVLTAITGPLPWLPSVATSPPCACWSIRGPQRCHPTQPHAATHLSDTSLGSPPASSAGCSLAVAVPLVLSLCSCPLGTTGSRGHCCPSPHGMPACTPSRHSSCSWRGQAAATAARRPCSEGEGVWPSPACAWVQRQGAAQQQCRQGLGQRGHPSLTQWGGSPGCSPLPEPNPVGAGTHWWCPGLTLCRCWYKNKHRDLLQPCPCPECWGGWQGAAGGHPSGTGGLGGEGAAGAQEEAGTQGTSALQQDAAIALAWGGHP